MRHGWGYIYELPPICSRFEELADHFALDGISLADPGTGRVIRLSSVGEQISSSRQDILNECRKSHNVSFNLYLAASDNLFCSIEKLNSETVREELKPDGKTQHYESERIIKNLTELSARGRKAELRWFWWTKTLNYVEIFIGTISSSAARRRLNGPC